MKEKRRKITIKNIIPILFGVLLVFAMVWKVGWSEIYKILLGINLYFLAAATLLVVCSALIKAVRWAYLFRDATLRDAFKVYFIGQAVNQILPIGSGELTRAYIGKSRLNVPVGKTLAYAVVERVADTTFLIILSIMFFALVVSNYELWIYLLLSGSMLVALYIFLLKSASIERILGAKPRKGLVNLIWRMLGEFRCGISILKEETPILVSLILLTIISWAVNGISYWLLIINFNVIPHLLFVIAAVGVAEIVGAFSFLPGGLGAKEASFTFVLIMIGVQPEIGFAVALISRAIGYAVAGGGAVISLLTLRKRANLEK